METRIVMKARKIQCLIMAHYRGLGYTPIAPNCFYGLYEEDVLAVSKSKLLYKFEVKISRADFLREFTHKALSEKWDDPALPVPSYFYFVCPKGLIPKEDVPEYAGLIYLDKKGRITFPKRGKRIHRRKVSSRVIDAILSRLTNIVAYGIWAGHSPFELEEIEEFDYPKEIQVAIADMYAEESEEF